jgi:hypothetical protein
MTASCNTTGIGYVGDSIRCTVNVSLSNQNTTLLTINDNLGNQSSTPYASGLTCMNNITYYTRTFTTNGTFQLNVSLANSQFAFFQQFNVTVLKSIASMNFLT